MQAQIDINETPEAAKALDTQPALMLVTDLCQELRVRKILYCHWKSNNKLDQSASAENDLDLLVGRESVQEFMEILYRLGFRQAFDRPDRQMPGVLDFYGYDRPSGKFVHVHAHTQLVLGHDATKNYRLPIERHYLDSIVEAGLFDVPSVEFEYVILVIRMMIKHFTWDVVLLGNGRLHKNELEELAYLQERIDPAKVTGILQTALPCIGEALFERCVHSLTHGASMLFRMRAGEDLRRSLRSSARRNTANDILLKYLRRFGRPLERRLFHASTKKRLGSGGLMIAIIGGDGSGKTTAIQGLYSWLKQEFEIRRIHMGKPRWSLTTILVRSLLKVGRSLGLYPFAKEGSEYAINTDSPTFPGYPWLIREVCTARDRCQTYLRARRFASNGGLVLSDRFPLAEIRVMDGPQVERVTVGIQSNRFIRFLANLEKSYYKQMMLPDLLVALRVDPEISVQRKTDEPAYSVRARAGEVWRVDWSQTPVHLIDAGQSKEAVLADLKELVWSNL